MALRCNNFTPYKERWNGRDKEERTYLSISWTFDNELYFTQFTWELQSVPKIEQRSHENSRRLPSTFVVLVAFIDSKSVVIYVVGFLLKCWKKGVTSSVETVDVYMPHRKICWRQRLDWQISRRCLSQYRMKCCHQSKLYASRWNI